MNVLGVILARGNSVRVKNKNMRMLGGHPLFAWTALAAKRSMFLDDIVVSSDSEEILKAALKYEVCALKRPPAMATNEAESYPALMHAVTCWETPVDVAVLLQPTSPFRSAYDIDCCVMAMMYLDAHPAMVSVTCGEDVPNGAVYAGRVDWLRDALAVGILRPFDHPMVGKYLMPKYRSLDINTEADFAKAEAMMEYGGTA